MVRILERGIILIHPCSKNKSDKWTCLYFLIVFLSLKGNNCEIEMLLVFNTGTFPNLIHHLGPVKLQSNDK